MANNWWDNYQTVDEGSGGLEASKVLDKTIDYQDKFRRSPDVRAYSQAIPTLASMARIPDTTAGDLALVNSFAKIFDPSGVVMEGDQARVEGAAPMIPAIANRARSQLAGKGGRIDQKTRQELVAVARQRVAELARSYNMARGDYSRTAKTLQLNPDLIVGTHPGDQLVKSGLANRSGSGLTRPQAIGQPWLVQSDRDYASVPVGARYYDAQDRKVKVKGSR